jgi:hypothetical protein
LPCKLLVGNFHWRSIVAGVDGAVMDIVGMVTGICMWRARARGSYRIQVEVNTLRNTRLFKALRLRGSFIVGNTSVPF